ncbi:hypothetical protein D3C75_896330 [compost metagenome]
MLARICLLIQASGPAAIIKNAPATGRTAHHPGKKSSLVIYNNPHPIRDMPIMDAVFLSMLPFDFGAGLKKILHNTESAIRVILCVDEFR